MKGRIRILVGLFLIMIAFAPSVPILIGDLAEKVSPENIMFLFKWQGGFALAGLFFLATGIDKIETQYTSLRHFILAKNDPRILTEFDKGNK